MPKPRILIAEDEAIIRMDLREMLEEEGYEVIGEAGDGATALEMARELRPDLAILDIVMPGMDGLTAAKEIADSQTSAVLVLTAFSQREFVDRAARGGAMAYLVKPFDESSLIPAIEVALARWEENKSLAAESKDLATRLETRKVVERAKGRLMTERKMSESDAFRFIQKTAMEERMTMGDVARRFVDQPAADDTSTETS